MQSNRLQLIPPSLAKTDLFGSKSVLKLDNNPWIVSLAEALKINLNHLADFLSSEAYKQ